MGGVRPSVAQGGGKDAAGWTGIVKVTNASWGVASKRVDALLPGYGLAVIRNK